MFSALQIPLGKGPSIPSTHLNQLQQRHARNGLFLYSFVSSATIRPLDAATIHRPIPEDSYNGDVSIPFYEEASRIFADNRREGIRDDIPESPSVYHHVDLACQSPLFLSQEIPPTPALPRDQHFLARCDGQSISSLWGKQLIRLEQLISSLSHTEALWSDQIPHTIQPAAGKLKAVALLSLMGQANLGGKRWADQFISGFPLIGELIQQGVYPASPKEVIPTLRRSELFQGNCERFSARASKSGCKNGQHLWGEALARHQAGWLTSPFNLSAGEKALCAPTPDLNIAFRFGVALDGKLRACDDPRYLRTSITCALMTPIKLVSWDHIAQIPPP